MNTLGEKLIDTDLVVFVTPLYYYTMSAQIKAVIDRFHAKSAKIIGNKKAMLFATSYGADDSTMEGLEKTYESILGFMNWEDAGKLNKEQKSQLVKEFTKTASKVMNVPEQAFIVLLKENEQDNIGFGGQLLSERK